MAMKAIEDLLTPLLQIIKHGRFPINLAKRAEIRRRVTKFSTLKGVLHRQLLDAILLECILDQKIQHAISKVNLLHAKLINPHLRSKRSSRGWDIISRLWIAWNSRKCVSYASTMGSF